MNNTHDPAPATGLRAKIPNALTILRLVLAGVFFALLEVTFTNRPVMVSMADDVLDTPQLPRAVLLGATALFVLAAGTDALDGYLARKWNAVSRFGRIMDPFADKILVLGAFVYLASPAFAAINPNLPVDFTHDQLSGVAPWMVALIIARELLVTSIRGLFESQGVDFSADIAGKLKMIVQSLVIPLVLLLLALADMTPGSPARWVIDISVWVTVVVTVVSCVPYVLKGVRAGRGLIHGP